MQVLGPVHEADLKARHIAGSVEEADLHCLPEADLVVGRDALEAHECLLVDVRQEVVVPPQERTFGDADETILQAL